MNSQVIFRTETLCIEHFVPGERRSDKLAFIFTPSNHRGLEGNGYGGELLCRLGWDVVAVKSTLDDWFQQVPPAAFEAIAAQTQGYARRVGHGSSMGAYAALCFSARLALDTVLASSPQFAIDQPFDTRWAAYAASIAWRYRIDDGAIATGCKVFVVYDDADAAEREQVGRIAALVPPDRLQRLPIPFGGHPVANYLQEVGMLKDLLVAVCEHGRLPAIHLRRLNRRSPTYLLHFGFRLHVKGKPQRALRVVDLGLKLAPESAGHHHLRSTLLGRLGRADEAVRAAEQAIACTPGAPSAQLHADLSQMLALAGHDERALAAIDRALAIDDSQSFFHNHRSLVLERLGRQSQARDAAARAAALLPGDAWLRERHEALCRSLTASAEGEASSTPA